MTGTLSPRNVYTASPDVVARKIAGELVIIPLKAGIGDLEDDLFSLNPTGEAIWERLNGSNSIQDIVSDLTSRYEASAVTIQQDVMGIVTELLARGLVVES